MGRHQPRSVTHVFRLERWTQPKGEDWSCESLFLVVTPEEIFETPRMSQSDLNALYRRVGNYTGHEPLFEVKRGKSKPWPDSLNYIRQHLPLVYRRVVDHLKIPEKVE